MKIQFENGYSKKWMARSGPTKIFGKDVDRREKLSDADASEWFDKVWNSMLENAVQRASACDIDFVRSKVPHYSQNYINDKSKHREFTLLNCFFICQLSNESTCDQLWFIPSASGDPRTLYVKFVTVPIKEEFDTTARKLGWSKPEELAEKILLDFMGSVNRKEYIRPALDGLDGS